jgi:hypothetical protein
MTEAGADRVRDASVRAAAPAQHAARPGSPATARVLTLQHRAGNRAVGRLLARAPKSPPQGPVTTGVSAPVTRKDFEAAMARAGVAKVVVGDWDPGDPAPIYRSIVDAFEDFRTGLGGTPAVKEIRFAKRDPDDPNAPATYSAGRLSVFALIETRNKWLPQARSAKGATYPAAPGGALVGGVAGQQGGAPLPLPDRAASERRVIAHELGHGVVEGMLTPGVTQSDPLDKDLINRFKKAVGWFGNTLYDIQDASVRKAIQDEGVKPTAAPITGQDWNSPKWGEQPITDYLLAGAHEDFPESLMAYLYAPQLLKERSPARFKFMEDNKGTWAPILAAPHMP